MHCVFQILCGTPEVGHVSVIFNKLNWLSDIAFIHWAGGVLSSHSLSICPYSAHFAENRWAK
jgi:hypothetical protein